MKNILIINVFLIAVSFAACNEIEKYENASLFSFKDFKKTSKLNATTIEFDEPIMMPLLFVISDSLLIVQNIRTNNMLFVYNINTKKKVGEFIQWGSGPNDLLRIKNMQLVGSELYISDNQKRSIYKYNVNDFHKSSNNPVPIQKTEIDAYFTNLAYTDNGYVATAINLENKRLIFYSADGEPELATGEYPYYGKELTDFEKMEGFISSMVVSYKYKRIFLFGMSTDLIEIFDFQGVLLKKLHGPEQLFPQVKELRSTEGVSKVSANEKSKFAFFSPIIIADEIYVAYSGQHQKKGEESPPIQHILVFDMDCNPLRRYELLEKIVSFTVEAKTKTIYATSNLPEYHMIKFEP